MVLYKAARNKGSLPPMRVFLRNGPWCCRTEILSNMQVRSFVFWPTLHTTYVSASTFSYSAANRRAGPVPPEAVFLVPLAVLLRWL